MCIGCFTWVVLVNCELKGGGVWWREEGDGVYERLNCGFRSQARNRHHPPHIRCGKVMVHREFDTREVGWRVIYPHRRASLTQDPHGVQGAATGVGGLIWGAVSTLAVGE